MRMVNALITVLIITRRGYCKLLNSAEHMHVLLTTCCNILSVLSKMTQKNEHLLHCNAVKCNVLLEFCKPCKKPCLFLTVQLQ